MFKVYNKELTIKGYLFIYVFMMLKIKNNSLDSQDGTALKPHFNKLYF